jgi:hypothetical protein
MIHNPEHRIAKMLREIRYYTGNPTVDYHPSSLSKGVRRRDCCHGFWPDVYRHSGDRRKAARNRRRRGPSWEYYGCWLICGWDGEAACTAEKAVMKALRTTRRLVKRSIVSGK